MDYSCDNKFFIELYEKYADMVYRICYFYLGNSHDAQDAVQNIFLNVLRKNIEFNDSEHEKAFLIVSSKNYCKDILKSFWRRNRIDYNELNEMAIKINEDKNIVHSVMKLPVKYKLPIYLYYYEGYSVKEISEILNQKESTIQSQLLRGRKKLKIQLQEEGFYDRKRSKGTV